LFSCVERRALIARKCKIKAEKAQTPRRTLYRNDCTVHTHSLVQGAAERTPLFEKRINSKPKKIRQMFFYFWKEHGMSFYINVF